MRGETQIVNICVAINFMREESRGGGGDKWWTVTVLGKYSSYIGVERGEGSISIYICRHHSSRKRKCFNKTNNLCVFSLLHNSRKKSDHWRSREVTIQLVTKTNKFPYCAAPACTKWDKLNADNKGPYEEGGELTDSSSTM